MPLFPGFLVASFCFCSHKSVWTINQATAIGRARELPTPRSANARTGDRRYIRPRKQNYMEPMSSCTRGLPLAAGRPRKPPPVGICGQFQTCKSTQTSPIDRAYTPTPKPWKAQSRHGGRAVLQRFGGVGVFPKDPSGQKANLDQPTRCPAGKQMQGSPALGRVPVLPVCLFWSTHTVYSQI